MIEATNTPTPERAATLALGVGRAAAGYTAGREASVYYQSERVTLYHGDSIEFMAGRPPGQFSHFVTDPPYTAAGGSTNGRTSGADNQFFAFWLRAVCDGLHRVVRSDGCGFMFCDWRTVGLVQDCLRPRGSRLRGAAWAMSQALVWDRESFGMGAPFRNGYEMIAFAKGGGWDGSHLPKNISTLIRHRYTYTKREHHGAEKPVELLEADYECGAKRLRSSRVSAR